MRSYISLFTGILFLLVIFPSTKIYSQEAQGINPDGTCYGRTLLGPDLTIQNPNGLQIILSGTGNMQVVKKYITPSGTVRIGGNMYLPDSRLNLGTSNPYLTPTSSAFNPSTNSHGLVVAIGNTYYRGGSLPPIEVATLPLTSGGKFDSQSQTCQNNIDRLSIGQTNELKFKITKNSLSYLFTVKYIYNYPETKFDVIYTVQIPSGNREEVKIAHAWDSYFAGSDFGVGLYKPGVNPIVGIKRINDSNNGNAYMGIRYNSGIPWSGYYASEIIPLNRALGNNLILNKSIANDPTDAGIGISMNYGSTPGSYSTSTTQTYECPAGDAKPNIISTNSICYVKNVNLYDYVTTPIPAGARAVFLKVSDTGATTGTVINNPESYNPGTTGNHYFKVYFVNDEFQCETTLSDAITISFNNSAAACVSCYPNPLTSGTAIKPITGISNLIKTTTAKTWLDNFSGAQLVTEAKTNGLVLNRLTTAEITAIQNPVAGMVVYDTTTNELKVYSNANGWKAFKNQYCPN